MRAPKNITVVRIAADKLMHDLDEAADAIVRRATEQL
jgi:hypothetical protein